MCVCISVTFCLRACVCVRTCVNVCVCVCIFLSPTLSMYEVNQYLLGKHLSLKKHSSHYDIWNIVPDYYFFVPYNMLGWIPSEILFSQMPHPLVLPLHFLLIPLPSSSVPPPLLGYIFLYLALVTFISFLTLTRTLCQIPFITSLVDRI